MKNLTADELEHWTELAGKFEYEAMLPRADAERMASEAIVARRMARMTGRERARALAQELR